MNQKEVKSYLASITQHLKELIEARDLAYVNVVRATNNQNYSEKYKAETVAKYYKALTDMKKSVFSNLNFCISKLYELDKNQSGLSESEFQTAVTLMNSYNSDVPREIVQNTLAPLFGNRVQLSAIKSIMEKNHVSDYNLFDEKLYDLETTYFKLKEKVQFCLQSDDDFCLDELILAFDSYARLVGGNIDVKESKEGMQQKVYNLMGLQTTVY